MRTGQIFRLMCLLVLSMIFSACGGTSASPTPFPLTQSFTSGDGTIKLNYPDKWVAQDLLGQVTVANGQGVVDAEKPSPGQFQARMFGTPISAMQGIQAGATPRDVLQSITASLSTSGVTFSAPTDLKIGTRTAARVDGSGTDGQAVVLAVDVGDGNYLFVSATSAPGELPGFEPTLLAIISSLTYTPLASPVPETTP